MLKKIKNISFLFTLFIFIFLTTNYYFSDKNIKHTNKSRSSYSLKKQDNLPLLRNDTSNIIVYKSDLDDFKKNRKKRFWEKLISNNINE